MTVLEKSASLTIAVAELGSAHPLHFDTSLFAWVPAKDVGVAGEEAVYGKGTALAFIIGAKDDEDVFDRDHEGQ